MELKSERAPNLLPSPRTDLRGRHYNCAPSAIVDGKSAQKISQCKRLLRMRRTYTGPLLFCIFHGVLASRMIRPYVCCDLWNMKRILKVKRVQPTLAQGQSGTCKNCVTCVSQNGGFWKKILSQVCHKILAILSG